MNVVFNKHFAAIMVLYHLTTGVALASYALMKATLFKRAQVSGVILIAKKYLLPCCLTLSHGSDERNTGYHARVEFRSPIGVFYLTHHICRSVGTHGPSRIYQPVFSTTAPKSSWKLIRPVLRVLLLFQVIVYSVPAQVTERFTVLYSVKNSVQYIRRC